MSHFENTTKAFPVATTAAGVRALNSLIKYVASVVLLYFAFVEENNHIHCIFLVWKESARHT